MALAVCAASALSSLATTVSRGQAARLSDRLVALERVGQHAGHEQHTDAGRQATFRPDAEIDACHETALSAITGCVALFEEARPAGALNERVRRRSSNFKTSLRQFDARYAASSQ